MAKKKKTAKKKAAKKWSRPRTAHVNAALITGGECQAADLAEVLREYGVDPARIPEAIADIRAVSDAQSGDGPSPAAPTPAPVDSTVELNVATAANAVVVENEATATQARTAISGGHATFVDGVRQSFSVADGLFVSGMPRSVFVGRAIHEKTGNTPSTDGPTIYEYLYDLSNQFLTTTMQVAVRTLKLRLEEGRTTRPRNNSASAAVRKNIKPRITLLMSFDYVEAQKTRGTWRYWLTDLGRQVFNGWPNWPAHDVAPNAGNEPAPEEPAGGPATEPT